MGTGGGAKDIEGLVHVFDPIPHRLIDGVFEAATPLLHRYDLRPEERHSAYVRLLPGHVFSAHEDAGRHAKQSTDHGRGDAMLPGARLGDQTPLCLRWGLVKIKRHTYILLPIHYEHQCNNS
jgi:hypothetical protein